MFQSLLQQSSGCFLENTDKIQQTVILHKQNRFMLQWTFQVLLVVIKMSDYILLKTDII
jgi:hypothetical protein